MDVTFDRDMTLIQKGRKGTRTFVFPKTTGTVASCAFESVRSLEAVVMNEGLHALEDDSFSQTGLKKITVPSTLRKIGHGTFSCCRSLCSFNCPESSNLREIGKTVFSGAARGKSRFRPR